MNEDHKISPDSYSSINDGYAELDGCFSIDELQEIIQLIKDYKPPIEKIGTLVGNRIKK